MYGCPSSGLSVLVMCGLMHVHSLTDALRLQIDTTRGKKRIVSTVAIKGRKLYICNGTVKCSAPGLDCDPVGGPGTVEAVEAVSQSFDVL